MLGWLHIASRVCQNLCFVYSLPVLVDYIDDSEQILDICSALAAECQISQLEKVKKCFFFSSYPSLETSFQRNYYVLWE